MAGELGDLIVGFLFGVLADQKEEFEESKKRKAHPYVLIEARNIAQTIIRYHQLEPSTARPHFGRSILQIILP